MEDNTRPQFSPDDARNIVAARYGIKVASLTELPSELDRNFRLVSENHDQYVLKIAHASVSSRALDLQNAALKHLAVLNLFPEIIPSNDGRDIIEISTGAGHSYRARLLNYIDGAPLSQFRPHSDTLLADIGTKLGKFSAAMQSFDHDERRRTYRWNIRNLPQVARYGRDLPPAKKAILDAFLQRYRGEVMPILPDLRASFVYNDANDTNIVVRARGSSAHVAGFIDFGDMVYSPTVTDLAVALAYIMMHARRPLEKALPVIAAYHRAFPLSETEIRLLFPLIAARLCLSVCISWHQQQNEPDNRHLSVSESGAWDLLEKLRGLHPRYAHYLFRDACGFSACPGSEEIQDWLRGQSFAPILGFPLNSENSALVNLGMNSRLLARVADLADPASYAEPLREQLGHRIGIGHYNEARPIYLQDMFAVDHHERRTIHLGVDLFAPADSPVYAPLAGTICSLRDHPAEQDYGPTLILKHRPTAELCFYTLYGHLSPELLDRCELGQEVQAGDLLAHIGDYPRNGNWIPHLHFQIIADLLEEDNFPGVCSPKLRGLYTSLSPDPNLILQLPFQIAAPARPSSRHLLKRRSAFLNPALSLSYQEPLQIERAFMQHLYDHQGQRYLDCVNNVPHVGHNHRRVVAAAQDQTAILNTNTRYLHETILTYAEALAATLPNPLSVCFFVNSGSEANELALRLASAYTGGGDFIVIDHAYHGHTTALIDISPYKFNGPGGRGKPPHVAVATMPDGYRGEARGYNSSAGEFYSRSVNEKVAAIQARGGQLAAFFAEGIMSCGGQMPLPAEYLQRAYCAVREAGGLCVADEVQTGFGRVGSHFWSFQLSGVLPDIVTLGKPIANGYPLGAVVTTPAIAAAFNNGMEYFNTFGGNPVACAVGLEVLNIIADENLQNNALDTGNYWMARLHDLQSENPIIGHIRGSGLFLGVELIRHTNTLEPAGWEATYIVERMKDRGILLSTEGPHHNVLKLKPPLVFRREDVDLFMDVFEDVLQDTAFRSS
ncbi:MAG: aminotransferase class III-fold pyridoxal phosphate-dependent enzyme [Chloroflexi bacterium]|nr:aminotransferase class III-fold pyridoxal phosphate-dependent enzyme [Chloroflexota bacterium]